MKVKELIEKLKTMDQEAAVILVADTGVYTAYDLRCATEYKRGDTFCACIEATDTDSVSDSGIALENTVYLEE